MERYLLFDSGCAICTKLAKVIEQETKEWLLARSLNEPAMQAMLDQARPDWHWEPTLLEVSNNQVRAFTGMTLRVRLVMKLGLRRAWRVARLVQRAGGPLGGLSFGRRRFLQQAGVLLAGLLSLGVPKSLRLRLQVEQKETNPEDFPTGELYAGFLLLPEGTLVPPMVKYPEPGIPIVCGVDGGRGNPGPTAVSQSFNTVADLAKEVAFPLRALNKSPKGLNPAGAKLIRYETGEVFAASIDYQSYDEQMDDWETTVSIWAQPDFPRPFPLWSSEPVEPGGPAVTLEKMDFLSAPGIIVANQQGNVLHWIEQDVLYTLISEHDSSHEAALELASLLTLVEVRD